MIFELTYLQIALLILSGIIVGFINTLAGGGTVISLSVFMMFGLSPMVANGTNRIPIILQNIASVTVFYKKKLLDVRTGVKLAVPLIFGALFGAVIAVDLPQSLFEKIIGGVLLIILFFMFYNPKKWTEGTASQRFKPVSWKMYLLFFFFGIYGGFIHVGIGYFFLAALVMGLGYDLTEANALKGLLVLLYVPISLVIFIMNNQVNYVYGFLHAIGNIAGASLASIFAVDLGTKFVRWVMIIIIILFILKLFGVIQINVGHVKF